MFLESVCSDSSVIESNIRETKLYSPDYVGKSAEVGGAASRAAVGARTHAAAGPSRKP